MGGREREGGKEGEMIGACELGEGSVLVNK